MPLVIPRRGLIRRPKGVLTYPGTKPGFDPSHPAANGIFPGYGFSWVGNGANQAGIALLTGGLPSTIRAGTSNSIDSVIGPCTTITGTGQGIQFPASTATSLNNAVTMGVIFLLPSLPAGTTDVFYTSNSSTSGWSYRFAVSGGIIFAQGATTYTWSNPLSGTGRFFMAVSMIPNGAIKAVVVSLDNGKLQTFSSTSTTTTSTSNGTYVMGTASTPSNSRPMSFAAVCHSPVALSSEHLTRWAADPWSFWYPR